MIGLKCQDPVWLVKTRLHTICRENIKEKKEDREVYNHPGSLSIYITSAFFFGPIESEVWLLSQPWGQQRCRAGQEQKQVATWNTSWFHYKDAGSLSSWEKIRFALTQTTHTWQAPNLVFTRVPPSPTLCLTRQFHCCKLSDKPSWSSHMLPRTFWSNRQLLVCSVCTLPAPGKHLQVASRVQSIWAWGDLHVTFLLLLLDHHVLTLNGTSLPSSLLNLTWFFCCSLCAFKDPRKVKPLNHILTQRWTSATQEYGSLVTFPFLPAGA